MKLILELESEFEGALEAGLDSFVRLNGWTDGHEQTQVEYAKIALMNYFRAQVTEYNIMKIGNPLDSVTQVLDAVTATLRTD